jgi:orotate phosphoribosyltransferase
MEDIQKAVAGKLLEIEAVKLNPDKPFTWASGWKSPIYCDNRKTLSYPLVRKLIYSSFCKIIAEYFPETTLIAGVATGAIAHGVLVAEALDLPFVYVRSAPKDHGLANLIEGYLIPDSKILIIEDLISTGGSSLKVLDALRLAGAEVIGMTAIFNYGFPEVQERFIEKECKLISLSNYSVLLEMAVNQNIIRQVDLEAIKKWRDNPSQWNGV